MKKILIFLTFITINIFSKDLYLKLNSKGHTSLISDVITTSNKDIITSSTDKTIRVWDSKTGEEKRKILGKIGDGIKGQILAIALTPDEKYLVAGGILGDNENTWGNIRVYNYKTGELLKILKSHTDAVYDLAFSADGEYLISGSGDRTAKIWRVIDWSLKDTITTHSESIYGVDVFEKKGDYFAVTVGFDGYLSLYNITEKKSVKIIPFDYKLQFLALNRINKEIAVCGFGEEINIFDFKLNHIRTINSETRPSGLAYSPDGRYMIVGSRGYPLNVNIYDTEDYYRVLSFKKHFNTVMAVNFLDNQTVVSAGQGNNEIYIWDIKNGKIIKKIEGAGQTIWSLGIKKDKIAWGNTQRVVHDPTSWSIQKYIDLNSFQIKNPRNINFNRIPKTDGSFSLEHIRGENSAYEDNVLLVIDEDETIAKIVRSFGNGIRHNCYGWYKDYIVSGGPNGYLAVYNKAGDQIANLNGHTGEIWSIALDGDRVVSGGNDQTINIWDLSKINFNKVDFNETIIKKYMKELSLPRKEIIDLAKEQGVNIYNTQKIKPELSIFVSRDNQWVIWTQNGYYNSSLKGAKYVGFHINRGVNKEAYFVTADKYPELYRPDIVDLVIQGYSEIQAIKIANKNREVKKVDIAIERPPILNLISSSSIKTNKNNALIKFTIDTPTEISKFIIARNGSKINKRSIERAKKSTKIVEVDLEDGENIITVRAKNRFAVSDPIIVRVFKKSSNKNRKKLSNLYLLSVGVSKYKNSNYNLQFADYDAKSIFELFRAQKGKLYKNIYTKILLNSKATTKNILKELKWLEKIATQNDTVVIFLAGHGKNDLKGNYYFISHDSDIKNLPKTSLKWTSIKRTIENLKSKVVLFTDTCHSGNVIGGRKNDITGALKSMVESGSEAVIISATSGRGYSIEKPEWKHGAFTKALIEGLGKWKANMNRDKKITVFETNLYLIERVIDLTQEMQKPTVSIPYSITDFPIIKK